MPLRSPKMYCFIFGFQRFVWWPKCTPASSSSFIVIAAKLPPLTPTLPFTELEALARPRHAVLLERQPQIAIELHERARDAESHGAGLSGDAATGDGGQDVELLARLGDDERL